MTTSGYSGTPLARKLGIKENFDCFFHNVPDNYFNLFEEMPEINVKENPGQESLNFTHAFFMSQDDMKATIPELKSYLKKNGSLWISWPKKSSKLNTDLDGNIVRKFGLDIGLVDVKVAAVNEIWSGLKFMYRIKDR